MAGFSIPLDQLAAKMQADLETVVRKATFDMYSSIDYKAPVKTGRFRANLNVSQGAVDTTTTESVDQSRAAAQIAKVATLPIGGVMYIANSLPYARPLEQGSSTQAPQGMFRLTALEFTQAVQKAIGEL